MSGEKFPEEMSSTNLRFSDAQKSDFYAFNKI